MWDSGLGVRATGFELWATGFMVLGLSTSSLLVTRSSLSSLCSNSFSEFCTKRAKRRCAFRGKKQLSGCSSDFKSRIYRHLHLPAPRSSSLEARCLLFVQTVLLNFAQRGQRDAALLEEDKPKYWSVAAILYRVRYIFTTENTEFTEKCLKNTNLPLCSAKRLGTLCGEKLFLAVSAFRSSDFISRQV